MTRTDSLLTFVGYIYYLRARFQLRLSSILDNIIYVDHFRARKGGLPWVQVRRDEAAVGRGGTIRLS
jgi:hypothetical protein